MASANHPPSGKPSSAAALWAPLAGAIGWEARLGARMERRRSTAVAYEFLRFGMKQAWACLFGGIMVALLLSTHFLYPRGLPLARYDFLFLAGVTVQALLLGFRMETWEEARIIFLYHAIGTAMEVFKTSVGSWTYPEPSFIRIAGVPLFSGFMYASIGSYIARSWRLFEFRFTRHPPLPLLGALSLAIYANFFADHYGLDIRPLLFAVAVLLFGRCWVHYRVWRRYRSMPLLLGLFLVALFIWIAENAGTYSTAWLYPHQHGGWAMVRLGKLGAWFLLLIVSYSLVAAVNRPTAAVDAESAPTGDALPVPETPSGTG